MKSWLVLTLLIVGYLAYLFLGALVVSTIESPYEQSLRQELKRLKQTFLNNSPCVNDSGLEAFLEKVISANRFGVSVLYNSSNESRWDFASSLFFSSTLVTTVGYGYTTPLTDSGKAFCIFYALVGVPFTMLVLSAAVQRLMSTFTYRPIRYFQLHRGYDRKKVTGVHFVVLALAVLILFLVVPSAIFSSIESSWSFLDAFYFCFISLCTIGLGDYVPGEQDNQWLRQLYKVSVAFYLLLGLMAMLLILQTFHKASDLHGLTDLFYLPHLHDLDDQEPILDTSNSTLSDKEPKRPLTTGAQTSYSTINR
ncbi:potassium channel subfamily K member 6 isoform X2 [Hyla sarda]|nr:potassium channel subfamily K member 6 isoform X2 [Hyla sarda]XP_056393605.1 potassium channel subfamily K member 6 isoform X2 [Hyla sarda]XP_056393606.1 potassium channel subfamily K member 6 isoform X2 [Hyla sarda]XP_056393607.1 potassium channel subfamily K member 6 isoform X2 [Hyla sarda]XP_056393610.1 potassium channel subfamily K member 6 isoform X2 [Hyla sarda]XP_056393611.1 potassium channel subfamily K member 6 isoform X2 [Hyla sarda]XP_056393612.1 potassium channel subfamily K me